MVNPLNNTKGDSFTPRKYKINLIPTLIYRCLRICSSSSLLQAALLDLKKTLLQNMVTRDACFVITLIMFWTDKRTSLQSLSPLFQRNIYSLSCLFKVPKVKFLYDVLNLVLVNFMVLSNLALFLIILTRLRLSFHTKTVLAALKDRSSVQG